MRAGSVSNFIMETASWTKEGQQLHRRLSGRNPGQKDPAQIHRTHRRLFGVRPLPGTVPDSRRPGARRRQYRTAGRARREDARLSAPTLGRRGVAELCDHSIGGRSPGRSVSWLPTDLKATRASDDSSFVRALSSRDRFGPSHYLFAFQSSSVETRDGLRCRQR